MLNSASTHHQSLSGGHLDFLRRVTEDDRFRTALETDPQAAMAEYGLHVDSEQIPSKVAIPSDKGILDMLGTTEDPEDPDRIGRDIAWWGFLGS